MAVVTLTSTSASPQNWIVPADCPLGTSIKVEDWGAASGGSGSSTSFRAGGAGAAYATAPAYIVTPHDVASGISFTLAAGSAGTGAANSAAGTDTSFSTNNINLLSNSVQAGATIGTIGSGGAYPTGWNASTPTIAVAVVGQGIDATYGSYTDVRLFGTNNTAAIFAIDFNNSPAVVTTPALAYIGSAAIAYVGGSLTNIGSAYFSVVQSPSFTQTDTEIDTSWTSSLQWFTATATWAASQVGGYMKFTVNTVATGAIDVTFRFAGFQFEQASTQSFWKSTPGYCLAKGGGATSGTTGGVGGAAASCIPTTGAFSGGHGATEAQGGGGGGSAGKAGAGTAATTGTGGTADNGTVAAGASNVEGGGGATSATSPSAGGAPGGGGAANTSTGSGSAGGRGQIRLTYTSYVPTWVFPTQCVQLWDH